MQAGRVGDEAKCPEDGHTCPSCNHVTVGPSTKGSPDVYINNQAALRVGDPGKHTDTCCGDNKWRAKTGSSTVTINGLPVHRLGDETEHCGGIGQLITASSDVAFGSGGNGAKSQGEKKSLTIEVVDAFGRALKGVTARILSPEGVEEVKFDGKTNLSGMHKGTTVIVEKALQESHADGEAVKGIVPNGTRMITPRKEPPAAKPAAPAAKPAAPAAKPAAPAPAAMTQSTAPGGGGGGGGGGTGGASAPAAAPAAPPAAAPATPPAAPAANPAAASTQAPPANYRDAQVPASNGTSTDPGVATVHRPEGGTVNVTQITVHNWVQTVYKAFNIPFPTGVWQISVLGVREASMLSSKVQGEDAVVKSEEQAGAGNTSATGGTGVAKMDRTKREEKVLKGQNTKMDDVLYVVWTETTVDKDQKVEVFQCTIDPGVDVSGKGHPFLLEGWEYNLSPVKHKQLKTYKNPPEYTQGGAIKNAFRVNDKGQRFKSTSIVRTKGKRVIEAGKDISGPIVRKEEPGINIHFRGYGAEPAGEDFGGWSAGCTVLRHALFSKRYKRFVEIIHKSKEPRPYLVVSSQYIRLYHEWVQYCGGDKQKAADPKSVLKEDALKERELNGKYIPSILDVKFAKANPTTVAPALFSTVK